jgi:hypothetical protein
MHRCFYEGTAADSVCCVTTRTGTCAQCVATSTCTQSVATGPIANLEDNRK